MITIRRPAQGAPGTRAYKVLLDGSQVGEIGPGESRRFPASPGRHTLQLKVGWCSSKPFELTLAGEPLTFACGSNGGRCACETISKNRDFLWIRRLERQQGDPA